MVTSPAGGTYGKSEGVIMTRSRQIQSFSQGATARRGAAALLLLAVASLVQAQPEKIKFDRLSLDGGLSQASANAIQQDAGGFMWIGTQDGLDRWDGYQIEVFKRDPDDPASLFDNFITNLWQDSDGRFWIFHGSGEGITLLDPLRRTFRRLVHDPADARSLGPSARFFNGRAVFEDSGGRVWLGTGGGGINLVDKTTLKVERLRHDEDDPESLAHDDVNQIFEASDGTLWISTGGGLQKRLSLSGDGRERFATYKHDPENPESLPDDEVLGVLEDTGGKLWVGTNKGLARFDVERASAERFLQGSDYPRVAGAAGDPFAFPGLIDKRGWLWVGTRAGLAVFERDAEVPDGGSRRNIFRHYLPDPEDPHSLSSRLLQDFLEDSTGDLWIATASGVNRYSPERDAFEVYVHDPADPSSLGDDNVIRIYESRSGILWFGTGVGGVSSFSRHKHKFAHVAAGPRDGEGLADDAVFSIFIDSEDTLWVGTLRRRRDHPGRPRQPDHGVFERAASGAPGRRHPRFLEAQEPRDRAASAPGLAARVGRGHPHAVPPIDRRQRPRALQPGRCRPAGGKC